MSARQYAAVEFKPGGRPYTYHFDGPELFPGDRVKVADREGDGWQRVTVVTVTTERPPFETKPILGRVEDVSAPVMTPLEQAEADRCKASDVQNIHNGKCTTCGQAPDACACLPF